MSTFGVKADIPSDTHDVRFGSKADIGEHHEYVRFTPKADISDGPECQAGPVLTALAASPGGERRGTTGSVSTCETGEVKSGPRAPGTTTAAAREPKSAGVAHAARGVSHTAIAAFVAIKIQKYRSATEL